VVREVGEKVKIDVATLRPSQKVKGQVIRCDLIRTLTITCRVTYDGSATNPVRVNLYFSPNGKQWDTVPYTYFEPDLSAGETVQETAIIDMPEGGYMMFEVENRDSSVSATNIKVWIDFVRWVV